MLEIIIPVTLGASRQYILNVLLKEFLGLSFSIEVKDVSSVQISYDNKNLTVADTFFQQADKNWLQPKSLPALPLAQWTVKEDLPDVNVVSNSVPVIFGDGNYLTSHKDGLCLGLDVFGSTFFMLSRYEEAVKHERDIHNRFPATASVAYQAEFLDRPIVNEYLEILWACMKKLWPHLKRKPREFRILLSHDIDTPFEYALFSPLRMLKRMSGDVLRQKNPLNGLKSWLKVKLYNNAKFDPAYTFDTIMDISECHNLTSTFYFITDHTAGDIDGLYSIQHPEVRKLIQKIHARGHEIGVHNSYNSYNDSTQTTEEFDILKKICEEESIKQTEWGSRQHFLRWETPTSFNNCNEAGLDYDTSLLFADQVGFRSGTCYEHTTYDVVKQQQLKLRERPLVAMECSVIDKRYMGLGTGENALRVFLNLKRVCQQFNGDFTLLWHNTRFIKDEEITLYEAILHV